MKTSQTADYVTSKNALVAFLRSSGNPVVDLVYWNNELVSCDEALRRAELLSGRERIARRRDLIYVAMGKARQRPQ